MLGRRVSYRARAFCRPSNRTHQATTPCGPHTNTFLWRCASQRRTNVPCISLRECGADATLAVYDVYEAHLWRTNKKTPWARQTVAHQSRAFQHGTAGSLASRREARQGQTRRKTATQSYETTARIIARHVSRAA